MKQTACNRESKYAGNENKSVFYERERERANKAVSLEANTYAVIMS